MKERILNELEETFNGVSEKEMQKALLASLALKIMYTRGTIIISNIIIAFLIGYGLYSIDGNFIIIPISIGVNFLMVHFIVFRYLKDLDNVHEEMAITVTFLNKKLKQLKKSSNGKL